MGAVASCLSTIVNAIGAFFMAIINGIGAIRMSFCVRKPTNVLVSALVRGIAAIFNAIINCICCGKGGGGRSRV